MSFRLPAIVTHQGDKAEDSDALQKRDGNFNLAKVISVAAE